MDGKSLDLHVKKLFNPLLDRKEIYHIWLQNPSVEKHLDIVESNLSPVSLIFTSFEQTYYLLYI